MSGEDSDTPENIRRPPSTAEEREAEQAARREEFRRHYPLEFFRNRALPTRDTGLNLASLMTDYTTLRQSVEGVNTATQVGPGAVRQRQTPRMQTDRGAVEAAAAEMARRRRASRPTSPRPSTSTAAPRRAPPPQRPSTSSAPPRDRHRAPGKTGGVVAMPPGSIHLDWSDRPWPPRHPDAVGKSTPPLPRGGTDSDTSSEDDTIEDDGSATLIIDSRHLARRDPGQGPSSS